MKSTMPVRGAGALLRRAAWPLAALIAFAAGAARSAEVTGLYDAQVPVIGQETGERVDAVRAAFTEVLVKVTGRGDAPSRAPLQSAVLRPMQYVQQFHYRSLSETGPGQDAAPYTQMLWVSFDSHAVNQLILDAGMAIWGRARPATLLWLAVEDRGARYLLGADASSALRDALLHRAQRRGLPLYLPLMDIEDQTRVRFADVWGNFQDTVLAASARYQAGAVLLGRLYRQAGGTWQARWTLYQDGVGEHWVSDAGSDAALLAAGVDAVTERLAVRYAQVTGEAAAGEIAVAIDDVLTLEDYARAMAYLRSLDSVTALKVLAVERSRVTFQAAIRGREEGLVQTIGFGATLAPVDPGPDAAQRLPGIERMLSYRLLP